MNDDSILRTASCVCGSLSVECRGEPAAVSLCHCRDCQRRTGSAFGIAAFFPREQVRVEGRRSIFTRSGETGGAFSFYFCPECGNTVYWETSARPHLVAVATGAFADPDFPAPGREHYTEHRHPWLQTDF